MRHITDKTISELSHRAAKALETYGAPLSVYETLGALQLEVDEVKAAMQARDIAQVRAELYDVANVAIRGAQALDAERT